MNVRYTPFEEFLARFNTVKSEAKGDPVKVETFYGQSENLTNAVDALYDFLVTADFERRFLHGPLKFHRQVPAGFETAWREYQKAWAPVITEHRISALATEFTASLSVEELKTLTSPDFEFEEHFDPRCDDGAAAIEDGNRLLEGQLSVWDEDRRLVNMTTIALEAWDYLQDTIGINIGGVFSRWRRVPVTFMPAHVSNKLGLTGRGSLFDLLDDAVRAYVAGAPAASVAMCRAALEIILKEHYLRPLGDPSLENLIDLAAERFSFIDAKRLHAHRRAANHILHDYARAKKLSAEDDDMIIDFLRNLKFLIQRAPT